MIYLDKSNSNQFNTSLVFETLFRHFFYALYLQTSIRTFLCIYVYLFTSSRPAEQLVLLDMYLHSTDEKKGHEKTAMQLLPTYLVDVLWGQQSSLSKLFPLQNFMNINGTTLKSFFWFLRLSAGPQKLEHKVDHNYFIVSA